MSHASRKQAGGLWDRLPKLGLFAGVSYYAWGYFGPAFYGPPFASDPNWPSLIAAGVFTGAVMGITADALALIGDHLDLAALRTASGHKGQARFAQLCEIEHEITKDGAGPYFGAVDGRAITSPFGSNVLVVGPPGSNKSVGMIVPTIVSILGPKVVFDLKLELLPVTAPILRARGERVVAVNLSNKDASAYAEEATYNLLGVIAENFAVPGGLRDISNDVSQISHQISPEPKGGAGQNQFFHDGARNLIAFGILMSVLIDGYRASLGDVVSLLSSKDRVLRHAQWGCGQLPVETGDSDDGAAAEFTRMEFNDAPWFALHSPEDREDFIAYFRELCAENVDLLSQQDSKSADSFLTQLRQHLERFNRSTRAYTVTKSSSFRFGDAKDDTGKPLTVFIIGDAARMTALEKVISLAQYCMYAEFLRHPKTQNRVHVISDETSNFKIHGLI